MNSKINPHNLLHYNNNLIKSVFNLQYINTNMNPVTL